MRHCPFCAEEIQDAAVVCKHCHRDTTRNPTRRRRLGVVLALLLLAGGVAVVLWPRHHAIAEDAAPSADAPREPIVVAIADGNAVEIVPGQYLQSTFELPDRVCVFTGHVAGVTGGNKDFEAVVLDADQYANWSTHHPARSWAESGRVAAWSPRVQLQGPGAFHLVVSNAFSLLTSKAVTIQANATCP